MATNHFNLFVFFILIGLTKIQTQGLCGDKATCLTNNPLPADQIPLFNGRCCIRPKDDDGVDAKNCKYYPNVTPGIIQRDALQCGTGIEYCNNKINDVLQNDYRECYFTHVELPYQCCYIGYRYSRYCMALDISDIEIFRSFEAQFRAVHGLSNEDILKIECGGRVLKYISGIFFTLLLLITF